MKIYTAYTKARLGTLTLSDVVQLLADQPVTDEESHAHMHMRDGFQIDSSLIKNRKHRFPIGAGRAKLNVTQYRAHKEQVWSEDAHLLLPGQSVARPLPPAPIHELSTWRVYQDPQRAAVPLRAGATISKYSARSNLPAIPPVAEVRGVEQYVKRLQPSGRGKPDDIPLAAYLPSDGHNYVMEGPTVKIFNRSVQVSPAKPEVPATEAHTMFEDSEAMVMHLCASLKSPAGINMLWVLYRRFKTATDTDKTVGIFSKTAVYAVRAHVGVKSPGKAYPLALIRTADTDAHRHLLGTFSWRTAPMDHVVTVLGVKGDELTVITSFPSAKTTLASINKATTNHEDLEEADFGHPRVTPALFGHRAPRIQW